MAKAKKRKGKGRRGFSAFGAGNKYAQALKMTKGRTCNRKAVLRAVKAGASPSAAADRHCR